jgi:hypothetical protein
VIEINGTGEGDSLEFEVIVHVGDVRLAIM